MLGCVRYMLCLTGMSFFACIAAQRSDFCSRMYALMNGTVSMKSFLKGQVVTFGQRQSNWTNNNPAWATYDSKTKEINGGFAFQLITGLAAQLEFTPKFVILPQRNSDTATSYLLRERNNVDFILSTWYTNTAARLGSGIGFTYGFPPLDSSFYLVVQGNSADSTTVDLSSFAMPFTAEVWGLLIPLLFVNGVVFFWFQANTLDNGKKGTHQRFWHYILTSYGEYVNVANLEPDCLELKLLQVGTGFVIVVFVFLLHSHNELTLHRTVFRRRGECRYRLFFCDHFSSIPLSLHVSKYS
jgi:hypothetical protein